MMIPKLKTHKGYRLSTHDPVRNGLLAVGAVVLLAVAGVLIYSAGYRVGNGLTITERSELISLRSQVAYLAQRNQDLTEKAARLGRSGEIDREAARRVQKNLNEMEARLTGLTEELAFYRSIVSPSGKDTGLRLQQFQIQRANSGNSYSFSLVLTQLQRSGQLAKGHVDARIVGEDGGVSKTLDLAQLAKLNLNFSFRYFQDFQGTFELPAGFSPQKVVISVTPYTRNIEKTEKSYTWAEVLGGG